MLFNQVAKGRFSAIAASSNPTFERGCAKARSPSIQTLRLLKNPFYEKYHPYESITYKR